MSRIFSPESYAGMRGATVFDKCGEKRVISRNGLLRTTGRKGFVPAFVFFIIIHKYCCQTQAECEVMYVCVCVCVCVQLV